MTLKHWYRLGRAAKKIRVKRQTLADAVDRGDIPHQTTGCGLRMISLIAAKQYFSGRVIRRGRPRKDA